MDGTRFHIALVALIAGLWAPVGAALPATGLPHSPSERARFFAICAGRFSALSEHERLFDGAASERADATRNDFQDLLDAVLPDARNNGMPGEMVLSWRLAAKHAQAALLHRAVFQRDTRIAAHARRAADRLFAECRGRLLGG